MMQVTYRDHMGTDLSVVNAARVSFGKQSEWVEDCPCGQPGDRECSMTCRFVLKPEDAKLIQFLARGYTTGDWEKIIERAYLEDDREDLSETIKEVRRHATHWSPFAHTAITLHIKAPIFVARQIGKHQVGLAWNEVSRRYVASEPVCYVPEVWRKRASNVKQGSSEEAVEWTGGMSPDLPKCLMEQCVSIYNRMVNEEGICPEQARMVLPQSMMTEWVWTGSLMAFARVYQQRIDPHAQRESQEIARQIGEVIAPLYPVSWEALTQ